MRAEAATCETQGVPGSDATPRFLTLADVAEVLNTSVNQVYALVRRGDLRGVRIGGRGQWRVENSALEDYIKRLYDDAERYVDEHPFTGGDGTADDETLPSAPGAVSSTSERRGSPR